MSAEETTLLYILSTLAQTCAALAAFVGAVGLFRLQLLREQRRETERDLRGMAAHPAIFGPEVAARHPFELIEERLTRDAGPYGELVAKTLHARRALAPTLRGSRCALIVFEAWNLFLIAVSLIGFNCVSEWAGAPWLSWALWFVAVITALITVGSVWVWTRGETLAPTRNARPVEGRRISQRDHRASFSA